jgi:hypothetical protein
MEVILYRVQPLLCDDCEIGGYARADSGHRLGKHIPAATNRRATIKVLLVTGCFYLVRAEELQGRQLGRPSQFCEERT